MIKAELEDLRVVTIETLEKAHEFFEMSFCEQVTVFVLDNSGRLEGIIATVDYAKMRNGNLSECINRNPMKIIESENTEDMARQILCVYPYKYVPVTDAENKLLYCYFIPRIKRLCSYDRKTTDAQIIVGYNLARASYPDKEILILGDCGLCVSEQLRSHMIDRENLKSLQDKDSKVVLIAYKESCEYIEIMEEIKKYGINYIGHNGGCFRARRSAMEDSRNTVDYMSLDNICHIVLDKEYIQGGKYFCLPDMENICQALQTTKHLQGSYVEIGVFRGDSARLAMHYMKRASINREAYFLDTYEGFIYNEADKSGDIRWNGTHTDTSLELVRKRLSAYEMVHCIKCNIISDGLPEEIKSIAVCNIDVDMEEAVYAALYQVKDFVVRGGIIIAEDYGHMPDLMGANYAVNQFIKENKDDFTWLYLPSGQMFLIKR